MGVHWLMFNYQPDQSCRESIPYQITYNLQGNLNGVVFQHMGNLDGDNFEHPTDVALTSILTDAPTCLYDLVEYPGFTSLHVYVDEYVLICP